MSTNSPPASSRAGGTLELKGIVRRVSNEGLAFAAFVTRPVFQTDGWTFLKFARSDLQDPPPRGSVNALSNAKRAVENRVDTLLYAYGISAHDKRDSWSYPAKARKLRDAGLPVRDVMQNMIVFVRNDLEHEYKIPGEEIDIKNSVDVAELFLLATDSKIGQGFFRWVVGPRTVPDPSDPSGFKAGTLPHDTFGLLVDYEYQSITSFDGP